MVKWSIHIVLVFGIMFDIVPCINYIIHVICLPNACQYLFFETHIIWVVSIHGQDSGVFCCTKRSSTQATRNLSYL